jgi:hypothetical protein
LRQNNGEQHFPAQVLFIALAGRTRASGRRPMKFLFGRREKFLYRRNPVYASFLSGTRFGLALAALVYLAIKLV